MIHNSTIKAQVRKQFEEVIIGEIKHKGFGIFSIKIQKEMKRSTKIGLIFGETDFDAIENGVLLDQKITWL